jgi:phospholipase/lecithinase/hemolysin
MSRTMNLLRGAAVAGLLGTLISCQAEHTIQPLNSAGDMFQSYVALGNSLTAGYQSGGINDSTQRRGYPVLLAQQFGTRFAYPALLNPGCPPPISSFQTGARVTPPGYPASTSTSCYLRSPTSVTDILNNVAVPGANVADLTSTDGTSANPLTTLVLGGLTQAQRALMAKPTFATIWIGNNDVLEPALTGEPAGATPLVTFTASYDSLVNTLMTGAPNLKGVLIGVVQVAAAPQLFPAAALQSPAFVGGLSAAVGTTVVIHPDCYTSPGDASLINIQIITLLQAEAAAGGTPTIVCAKGDVAGQGDYLVLDQAEQATVAALINSYNSYISAKAASIGFAYWDPNVLLDSVATQPGAIDYPPNLASTSAPFGTAFSLDGVHPSSSAHILIANAIIQAINDKYGTSVRTIQ